jgi:hypothetical protein
MSIPATYASPVFVAAIFLELPFEVRSSQPASSGSVKHTIRFGKTGRSRR